MIFVTVGTQGSFDRLVRTVDDWAGQTGRRNLFAQVGPSDYQPKHFEAKQFVHPEDFRKNVEAAEFIVAHAGMGSIITALEFGKQVVVMPRRCDLREHRNDHQIATAKRLCELGLVQAAFDEAELHRAIGRLQGATAAEKLPATASPQLLSALRDFVESGTLPMEPWRERAAQCPATPAARGSGNQLHLRADRSRDGGCGFLSHGRHTARTDLSDRAG